MMITWEMIAWAIGILIAWSGFLLGGIKWLLSRQITAFEAKVADAEAKASKALANHAEHKQAVASDISDLRLEFERKAVCSNHQRMENDNEKQFGSLDKMHASIRGISEKINGVANNVDLLLKHHIAGGN
jgi:hypothetical protein